MLNHNVIDNNKYSTLINGIAVIILFLHNNNYIDDSLEVSDEDDVGDDKVFPPRLPPIG